MGRVPVNPQNRTGEGGSQFPVIELTQKGQKTRFTLIEDPWREYVHYIKCPKFDDRGKVIKETKYKKNGDSYEDLDQELVGSEICLGDEGILQDKGVDERNCPACEANVKSGGDILAPTQRFAGNVAEYVTDRSNSIKKPFSATIKVWKFTGRMYDEIEGLQQEIGPLNKHDLTLECEDPNWKRYKVGFKLDPGYKEAPPGYMKELLGTPGNKATDAQLKDACGREVSRTKMQDDVTYALKQWARYRNEGQLSVQEEFTSTAADLSGGIDELLGEETEGNSPAAHDHAAAGTQEDDPWAEFSEEGTTNPSPEAMKVQDEAAPFGESTAGPAEPAGEAAPTASPGTGTRAEAGGAFDFDNLLDGI